jgi:hypothetical protein
MISRIPGRGDSAARPSATASMAVVSLGAPGGDQTRHPTQRTDD